MWSGILIVLVIIILVVTLTMVIILAQSYNKPCNDEEWKNPCPSNMVIIYNGSNLKPSRCDNHGRLGNTEYIVVHKNVKTYIPFRVTKIEGDYQHVILTPNMDEADHIHIHRKSDGIRIIGKPNTWKDCYAMVI